MAESRLHQLSARGQSVWIDYLSRDLLETGELKRMMEEDAVVGVTSNPTIFQKAISQGNAYDEQIKELLEHEQDAKEIFLHLAVRDVENALDLLAPVHEANAAGRLRLDRGRPDPRLRHEGDVRRGDPPARVDRPAEPLREDPGHRAGPEGDRGLHRRRPQHQRHAPLLAEDAQGVDGGVRPRARALRRGRRRPVGGALGRELLRLARRHRDRQAARGDRLGGGARASRQARDRERAASRTSTTRQVFSGERWDALEAKGALPQRCLWASTSTKNPEYRDVLYVEELIGPHTVNTMPEETIQAFQDHGEVRGDTVLENALDEAQALLHEQLAGGRRRLRRRRGAPSSRRACRSSPTRSPSCSTA